MDNKLNCTVYPGLYQKDYSNRYIKFDNVSDMLDYLDKDTTSYMRQLMFAIVVIDS